MAVPKLSKSEAGKLGAIKSAEVARLKKKAIIEAYGFDPAKCIQCHIPLEYEKRDNKFCGHTCSASFNNRLRAKTFQCQNCGNINPERKSPGKYCDRNCQIEAEYKEKDKLVEAGNASNSGQMKKYLLRKHGNVCMSPTCAWDFTKVQINVELEHQDGNSDNNTLGNCILLCPNCHSLTPTYKAKNKGNGRHYRRVRRAEGKSF